MKIRLSHKLGFIALALLLALVTGSFALARSAANDALPAPNLRAPAFQKAAQKGHPKMESVLWDLQAGHQQSGLRQAAAFALERGIELGAETVRVVVETNPGELEEAIKGAEALGAQLETTYKNRAQFSVPIPLLGSLADLPQVSFVRQPYPAKPHAIVTSEGAKVIGADTWQKAGISGKGVKVGIMDLGFYGYQSLLGTELPAKVTARSFRTDRDITGKKEEHGTAIAEIIYDLAPDAGLYLANFGTDLEFGNAVNWLINNKVDIISCSVGWINAGPYDGTGPVDDVVDNARDNHGILWFQSAGNEADGHWGGIWTDTTRDGYQNFYGGAKFNSIYARGGTYISIALNWDDPWGASSNDFDLYLYDNNYREVANSLNWQTGKENPTERIVYFATTSGFYHIAIRKYDASRNVKFSLFSLDYDLRYKVPEGSIGIPADAKGAIAVGATKYTDDKLESFSSQGPTLDGRVKPDLAAPDGVSTATYGKNDFYGTSAAAPHAAGAAALLKSLYPSWDASRIQAHLEGLAKDLGRYGKDNQYGAGRVSLGLVPVTPTPVVTKTPTPVTTGTPTITPTGTVTITPSPVGTPTPSPSPVGTPTPTPPPTRTPPPMGMPMPYRLLLPEVRSSP